MVCWGECLTLLQVTGSSVGWSYSQRNISLYPSFASYSQFSFHDIWCHIHTTIINCNLCFSLTGINFPIPVCDRACGFKWHWASIILGLVKMLLSLLQNRIKYKHWVMISATKKMQQNLFYWFFYACSTCFAHLQEHFDCVYSFLEQCTESAVCCWPVTQVGCVTGRRQTADSVRCSKKLYIQSKCSWRWAKYSPETCRESLKESIKEMLLQIWCFLSRRVITYKVILRPSSWRAWGCPYKVEICRPDKIYYFCI